MPELAPSILSADFSRLAESIRAVERAGVQMLHLDVMDGHFVPNITIGPIVVTSLRRRMPRAFLDCHVMVSDPARWFPVFAKAGVNQYTFHIECFPPSAERKNADMEVRSAAELCARVRSRGVRAAVAIKPRTPVDAVLHLCDRGLVDMILVMTVEPGFGGQKFMAACMPKVRELRARYPTLDIQVDGGLDGATARIALDAGANVLVAGTSVFARADRAAAINEVRFGTSGGASHI